MQCAVLVQCLVDETSCALPLTGLRITPGFIPTPGEDVLSDQMIHFWGKFAHGADGDMDPLPPSHVAWPRYTDDDKLVRVEGWEGDDSR